jgi:hypothetical protein
MVCYFLLRRARRRFTEAKARQVMFFEKMGIRDEEGKERAVDSGQSDLIRLYPS